MKLDIKYKYVEYVLAALLSILMFAIPLTHYYLLRVGGYNDTLAYTIYGIVSVILLTIVIGVFCNSNVEFEMGKYEYMLLGLIALAVLSTLSSLDKQSSLWGWSGRNEGLLMLLSYYTIFYGARAIKDFKIKNIVVHVFLLVGILHSVYGLCSYFGWFGVKKLSNWWAGVKGIAGNQNFMGSFLVLQCGVSAGLFYYSNKFWKQFLYLIILCFFLVTSILTRTMSALFGIGIMILVFFTYLLFTKGKHLQFEQLSKNYNSTVLLICSLLIGLVGMFIINSKMDNYLFNEFSSIFSQLNQMIGGEITEEAGTGRFIVWSNALKLVPKYWLYGCGVDTFGIAFTNVFGLSNNQFFDKAHNEYIQIMLTMGIPALLLYFSIYGNVIVDSIHRLGDILTTKGEELKEALYVGLGLAVIGYMAQAFFNISVIDVAPYFWMILGFASLNSNFKVKRVTKFKEPKLVIHKGYVEEIHESVEYE